MCVAYELIHIIMTFSGHYIVICGYDVDTNEFEIRDPASSRYHLCYPSPPVIISYPSHQIVAKINFSMESGRFNRL